MKTTFYLILILSLTYSLTKTQEYDSEPEKPALIHVRGTGVANTPPDEVKITVSFQQQADSFDGLNDLINNITSAVTKILNDANVADEDIESSNVAISPYYPTSTSSLPGMPASVSYQGKKTMRFTLKNNSDYDAVITDLYEAGITSVDSVVFQLSNGLLQAKTNEARKNAVANLLDSLETIVGGLGQKVGSAYSVGEYSYGGGPQPYSGYENARYAVIQTGEGAIVVGGEGGSGAKIAPDDFVISSTVFADYYIV